MQSDSIFDYKDYREYLRFSFPNAGERRGKRSHLANYLHCQVSFLSQVLTDRGHISLEHAIKISEYLKHSSDERDYFILLVHRGKAGNKDLEHYFNEKIIETQKKREEILERVQVKTQLNIEDQMKYYSAWYFLAIHILCAFPDFNSAETIATRLKLEIEVVKEAFEFLETRGFIKKNNRGKYEIGVTRLHLPKGSSMLPRHHANWRMKAIESVDHERKDDLHYSVLLGISKADQKVFREKILKLIEEFEPVIQKSKVETPVVLVMDLFEL